MRRRDLATIALLSLSACTGTIVGDAESTGTSTGPGTEQPGGPGTLPPGAENSVGKSGARRLTNAEMNRVLRDVLGDTTSAALTFLPEDNAGLFDNDFTQQKTSTALVEGLELMAADVARRALTDTKARSKLVTCAPTGPGDKGCMTTFLTRVGRRMLRRPLTPDELADYLGLQSLAIEANDFYKGVELALRAFLMESEFLYRVEVGTPEPRRPGIDHLTPWELASRLSFLLWGTAPDDALLDVAAGDGLRTPDDVTREAARLLADPRARDTVKQFHALWLGYAGLPNAGLGLSMKKESAALIDRVIFERKLPWTDLFASTETYVDDALAKNYGLPSPGTTKSAWVKYGSNRKGMLSQGSFLIGGTKMDGTHPVLRGKMVRNMLLCQEVPPPPPDVVAKLPEDKQANCKVDKLSVHARGGGACSGCHLMMDPIGFGLERYDGSGRFRTVEPGKPECPIDGKGQLVKPDLGEFNGPGQLGDLLVQSGLMEDCIVAQYYRYAMGKQPDSSEQPLIDDIRKQFRGGDRRFDSIMMGLLSSAPFVYRRE